MEYKEQHDSINKKLEIMCKLFENVDKRINLLDDKINAVDERIKTVVRFLLEK